MLYLRLNLKYSNAGRAGTTLNTVALGYELAIAFKI